jgi:hypothetical protein
MHYRRMKFHISKLYKFNSAPNVYNVMKLGRIRLTGFVACMAE